ncbi:MAG: histidine kinase [Flavobacteriaceae bacterium]|nr:histidine kinase [Flavobacteriaceae bacterium]
MRKLLLFAFFLVGMLSNAQNPNYNIKLTPEFEKLLKELDDCTQDSEKDCLELTYKIIEKGKQEDVPFLDYLFFKKAFYFWHRMELDSVIVSAQLAIQNPNPDKKQSVDSEAYNILGNSYYYKGELETAINYYLKNAALLENHGNQLHLGYVYSNVATLFSNINNNAKQLEYLQKSFTLLEKNNDQKFIATVASNLGLAYYQKQDTAKTIEWSEKAIELSKLSHDLVAKTQAYITLSMIEKDSFKAEQYAEKSVQYADELNEKSHQAKAYYIYAATLFQVDKTEKAVNYIEKAINLAEEIHDNNTLSKASSIAAKIFYKLGNKDRSAELYYTYEFLRDSIYSVENTQKINEINANYEFEKKEKQIAENELKIQKQQTNLMMAILGGTILILGLGGSIFYNKRKQQQKIQQIQQEKENAILNSFILGEERERSRISHELHDGVASLIGAAKMSLESIPHLPQEKRHRQLEKVVQILDNSHADIRHIAHKLLPIVLEKEGLIQATQHFVNEINETNLVYISVTDYNSKANEHPKQLQLMLFRIIQELVNNIVKHSQAQNAEIVFNEFQNNLCIEITDDGIGYDEKIKQENQGLYSIAQRLKAMGGNFKISKQNKGGTQAKVELWV